MKLEPQTYYTREATTENGEPETEGVVPINDSQIVEKRGSEWYGPFDASDDYGQDVGLERAGSLTDQQFEKIIGVAERNA